VKWVHTCLQAVDLELAPGHRRVIAMILVTRRVLEETSRFFVRTRALAEYVSCFSLSVMGGDKDEDSTGTL